MKKENLKIANEIQEKIKDLNDHKRSINSRIDDAKKIDIRMNGESNNYSTRIRPELSPVPFDVFIDAYYAIIDAEIKKLETKLEML